jgi:hypothetical protein
VLPRVAKPSERAAIETDVTLLHDAILRSMVVLELDGPKENDVPFLQLV